MRRFLIYHLADNVAEPTPFALWALTGGSSHSRSASSRCSPLDIGTDMLPALGPARSPPANG